MVTCPTESDDCDDGDVTDGSIVRNVIHRHLLISNRIVPFNNQNSGARERELLRNFPGTFSGILLRI
jgi:hypothetical protein